MIKIEQAIIVEGKYDKIKVSSFIDAVIIVLMVSEFLQTVKSWSL